MGNITPAIICSSFSISSERSTKPSESSEGPEFDSKTGGNANIAPLLLFDYPTFNLLVKMNPLCQFFYAISPTMGGVTSVWYDRLIKVDSRSQQVVATGSEDGTFLSEATFR